VPEVTVAVLVTGPPLLPVVTRAVMVSTGRSAVVTVPIVQRPVPGTYVPTLAECET